MVNQLVRIQTQAYWAKKPMVFPIVTIYSILPFQVLGRGNNGLLLYWFLVLCVPAFINYMKKDRKVQQFCHILKI